MSLQTSSHEQERVIVGVDFGMTFSAVSWAVPPNKLVRSIGRWPELPGRPRRSTAVPSEISYLPHSPAEFAWGYQGFGDFQPPRYRWFKASLETEGGSPESYQITGANDLHNPPGSSDSLITDYLTCLRKHVEQHIPSTNSRSTEYVLAVPPGWLADSQSRAQACAQKAGMGLPNLVLEPQAAAVYYALREHDSDKVGKMYILCDAGGRTVDLTSFIYKGLEKPVFPTTGNQGNCGSTVTNMCFEQFLEKNLRCSHGWSHEARRSAMDYFEWNAKRIFNGDDTAEFKFPVHGMADNSRLNIQNGVLYLYGAELRPFIGPVVDEVVSLVNRQIDDTKAEVHGVILVGGFAESPFLYNSVTKRTPRCIPVMRPPEASVAVAAGAVTIALERE